MRMHSNRRRAAAVLLVSLALAGCGDAADDAEASGTDAPETTQAETPADEDEPAEPAEDPEPAPAEKSWSATSSGPEDEEYEVDGNASGFYAVGDVAPDVATLQLNERGRAVVLLYFPAALVETGGTFDMAESLPGIQDNAILLGRYAGAATGQFTVEPGGDGTISGTFAVTVADPTAEATVDGTFTAIDMAE